MDIIGITAKIARGYGKAASVLGAPVAVYRPIGTSAAIVAGNQIGTLAAAFDTVPQFSFVNPTKLPNRVFYMLADATGLAVGDYVVTADGMTYFLASVGGISPPVCIRCDRTMSIVRPADGEPGPDYYGGDTTATELVVLAGWPGAVLPSGRGQIGDTGMPSDAKEMPVQVFMPATAPQMLFADYMLDDLPTPGRYIIDGAALSAWGWDIRARQVLGSGAVSVGSDGVLIGPPSMQQVKDAIVQIAEGAPTVPTAGIWVDGDETGGSLRVSR